MSVATIPWDDEAGLPDRFVTDRPTSAGRAGRERRQRRPRAGVRALADGGVQVDAARADGGRVLVRLSGGRIAARLELERAPADAELLPDGDAVVLAAGALRRVGPGGEVRWERPVTASRMVMSGERIILVGEDGRAEPFDRRGRPAGEPVALGPAGEVLAAPDGRLAVFFAAGDTRRWACVDLATGDRAEARGSAAAWPFLGLPLGVDAAGRAFGRGAGELARIGLDGEPDRRLALDDVPDLQPPGPSSVTSEGAVLAGVATADGLQVVALTFADRAGS